MPGRRGYAVSGGWATSGGASGLPATLTLNGRTGNQPGEYTATDRIDFETGFASADGDNFEAYLATEAGSGSNSSLNGSDLTGGYRYGFNGKEKDEDISGLTAYDYGFRIYNPSLGKFLSVDPLQKQFPWLSPYQFSANSPILFVDLDGREPKKHINNWVHRYDWAKKDWYADSYHNYFTLQETDPKGRPILVRSKIIGAYPYTDTRFQYYNYDSKDYYYFVPTGFEPDYVQNLKDLRFLGEFGKGLEKAVVLASTMWNPFLRGLVQTFDVSGEIDRHGQVSTKDRVTEIHKQTNVSERVKNGVLTIAVADAEDKDGVKFRLVSINSASQQNKNIMDAVKRTLKPNEILVPNILGGDAHAEENLNEFAKRYGLTVTSLDVNRPFCQSCGEAARRSGTGTSTTISKRGAKPRTPAVSRQVRPR